ncbi:bifunctional oligoribonuclease/PAP phosphatase NrnA, partial [Thermodesulfobacteriota bacterium]
IEDVKVAVLIQEHDNGRGNNRYNVSLRSDGTVDVAEIAASFGGGGHVTAAGFNIESTLNAIKSEINNLAEKL